MEPMGNVQSCSFRVPGAYCMFSRCAVAATLEPEQVLSITWTSENRPFWGFLITYDVGNISP